MPQTIYKVKDDLFRMDCDDIPWLDQGAVEQSLAS